LQSTEHDAARDLDPSTDDEYYVNDNHEENDLDSHALDSPSDPLTSRDKEIGVDHSEYDENSNSNHQNCDSERKKAIISKTSKSHSAWFISELDTTRKHFEFLQLDTLNTMKLFSIVNSSDCTMVSALFTGLGNYGK
jgi:CHAT domain-containing protein